MSTSIRTGLIGLVLAGAGAGACAQVQLFSEKLLPQPIEPGTVAPHQPTARHSADVGATGMLNTPPAPGSTLQDWYARQGRPAVALFFDRRLERVPAGWDGTARLTIASEKVAGGKTETENVAIALERKAARAPLGARPALVQLVENALQRELQRERFRLVDPALVERAQSARGKPGDTEFDGLRGAAAYLLEVELAATGSAVSMIGGLKSLGNGEIVATVRTPVDRDLADPAAADALARALVKRLLGTQTTL